MNRCGRLSQQAQSATAEKSTPSVQLGVGLTAAALGLATAVGGGVLRDVLVNEVPSLLRWDRDLHAVPAIVGATLVVFRIRYDTLTPTASGLAAVTAFGLRLLAMRFHWRAPRAWNRRSTVREE